MARTYQASDLLEHLDWARRLAASLLRKDPSAAEDAVQEAWIAASRNPPPEASALRPWLSTILRRTVGRHRRGEARRAARERDVARPEAVEATVDIVARAAAHRDVVNALMGLEEPYRATLVLRYFEGLGPKEIAERQEAPLDTVRSRLRRGLDKLRAQLDSESGDPRSTRAALLLLAGPEYAPSAFAAERGARRAVSSARRMRRVNPGLALGAAAALVVAAATAYGVYALRSGDDVGPSLAGAGVGERAVADAAENAAGGGAAEGERRLAPPTEGEDSLRARSAPGAGRALLVDPRGRALPGITLRKDGPYTVRWQGGDVGWISNVLDAVRVRDKDIARLRDDAVFAGAWFARFAHPEEWRATILGSPIAERELVTDGAGSFAVAPAVDASAIGYSAASEGYTLLARGFDAKDRATFVASRAVALRGRCLDVQGRPVVAFVTWGFEGGAAEAPLERRAAGRRALEVRSGRDGRYLVRRVPSDVPLIVRARTEDGRKLQRRFEPALASNFDLRFVDDASGTVSLRGLVLDQAGAPVGDAQVAVGKQRCKTDARGRFTLEGLRLDGAESLTAWATGFEPAREPRLREALSAGRVAPASVVLRLGAKTRSVRGQVVDARGVGVAAARVALEDPLQLAYSFTPLEARVGARGRHVECDAEGRFTLAGLSARNYSLRVWSKAGMPLRAGVPLPADAKTLRVQVEALRARSGVLRDVDGNAIVGAKLAIVIRSFANASGGGTMSEMGAATASDGEGRFSFERCPERAGCILVQAPDGSRSRHPLAGLPASGELELRHRPKRRWAQILPSPEFGAESARVLDAKGRVLSMELHANGSVASVAKAALAKRGAAWFVIPPAATTLQFLRGEQLLVSGALPKDAIVLRRPEIRSR